MDYREVIEHLKKSYPDEFSEDGFSDGAIELMLNHFYHGIKHLVSDQEVLVETVSDLCHSIAPNLDWFVMSYAAEAYMQAKYESQESEIVYG